MPNLKLMSKYEKEACIINLLEIYFPYMQNAIFYYKKQNEKEYNKFFISDFVLNDYNYNLPMVNILNLCF